LQSSATGTLSSNSIQNYLKIFINSGEYYLPLYRGTFTQIS
jgi:hypothetical protein